METAESGYFYIADLKIFLISKHKFTIMITFHRGKTRARELIFGSLFVYPEITGEKFLRQKKIQRGI